MAAVREDQWNVSEQERDSEQTVIGEVAVEACVSPSVTDRQWTGALVGGARALGEGQMPEPPEKLAPPSFCDMAPPTTPQTGQSRVSAPH